jgi:hypothetical protein
LTKLPADYDPPAFLLMPARHRRRVVISVNNKIVDGQAAGIKYDL